MPEVAFVTGAAKRIGRALSLALAKEGYRVAVHYSYSPDEAEALVEDIREIGGEAMAIQADFYDPTTLSDIDKIMSAVEDRLGAPTLLINNASVFELDTIETVTPVSWDRHLSVNLTAPLFLSQAFAKRLPAERQGNIINVIDQRVWKLTPNFTSYTVSKVGLWTLTQTLAQALAPRIRVNAIGPGPTLKSIHQSDEDFARQQAAVPLKRGPGLDEMCGAVTFLLATPSVTGQMIALDGGQHLSWQTPDVVEAMNQTRNRNRD